MYSVAYFVFLTVMSLAILFAFHAEQPEPYMDEIFHFPQALKYFHGEFFEWNPKITTPPGLYLISVGILVPLSKLSGIDLCHVLSFRLINLLFTIGNFYVLLEIVNKTVRKGTSQHVILLSALNLATFPVLYFFTFLYYTDCGSVFFTLLMYLHYLRQEHWVSATYGGIAVLFRQTNIVWVFMVAAHGSLLFIQNLFEKNVRGNKSLQKSKRQHSSAFANNVNLLFCKDNIFQLARINFGYIIVGLSFIVFLLVNESIALGDKEAHEACFNVPQLLYFLLFSFYFAIPLHCTVRKALHFLEYVVENIIFIVFCATLCGLTIKYLSHVHPYLLSDNRHLTFYLWKRLLGRNFYVSLSLLPLYLFSAWSIFTELRHKDILWKSIFIFCIVVATVPQKLLELRYFIIPHILFRLNVKSESFFQLVCEFILNIIINFVSLYLFFERTFSWENDNAVQRIMW